MFQTHTVVGASSKRLAKIVDEQSYVMSVQPDEAAAESELAAAGRPGGETSLVASIKLWPASAVAGAPICSCQIFSGID